jgi:hypothetical protein
MIDTLDALKCIRKCCGDVVQLVRTLPCHVFWVSPATACDYLLTAMFYSRFRVFFAGI